MKYCEFFKKKCEYIEDGFKCSKADSINIKIAIKCNDFKCPLSNNEDENQDNGTREWYQNGKFFHPDISRP